MPPPPPPGAGGVVGGGNRSPPLVGWGGARLLAVLVRAPAAAERRERRADAARDVERERVEPLAPPGVRRRERIEDRIRRRPVGQRDEARAPRDAEIGRAHV